MRGPIILVVAALLTLPGFLPAQAVADPLEKWGSWAQSTFGNDYAPASQVGRPVRGSPEAGVPLPTGFASGPGSLADAVSDALGLETLGNINPTAQLVQSLADPQSLTPQSVANAVRSYFHQSGYAIAPVGSTNQSDVGGMNGNASLSFTFNAGDADGDGAEDAALDLYCTAFEECLHPNQDPYASVPPRALEASSGDCDQAHKIVVVQGGTRKELWERRLSFFEANLTRDASTDPANGVDTDVFGMCWFDFVLGTIANDHNARDILVYSFAITGDSQRHCMEWPTPPTHCSGTPAIWSPLTHPASGSGFASPNNPLLVENALSLWSAVDGHTIWRHVEPGFVSVIPEIVLSYTTGRNVQGFRETAHSLLLNPLLFEASSAGVDLTHGSKPALLVNALGYNITVVDAKNRFGGGARPDHVIYAYWPDQWAAKINLTAAAQEPRHPLPLGNPFEVHDSPRFEWHKSTFYEAPERDLKAAGRSIMPFIPMFPPRVYPGFNSQPVGRSPIQPPYSNERFSPMQSSAMYDPWGGQVGGESNWYWNAPPCCFDVTGDGMPDLVYDTLEWNTYPDVGIEGPHSQQGPYFLASSLVAFNGSTGDRAWTQLVEPGTAMWMFPEKELENGGLRRPNWAFYPYTEDIGDLNGDGASDVLLHMLYYDVAYRHVVSARDGRTGAQLWNLTSPKEVFVLPLGGTKSAGRDDLALFEWSNWQFPESMLYQEVNVTGMRIFGHDGLTGRLTWTAVTFQAPIDLEATLSAQKRNGLADVDQDGFVDLAVDDPVQLRDLTIVHQVAWISGRDAHVIRHDCFVGAFLFPSAVGDIDRDGADDFVMLSGDVSDLWLTVYGSRNQTAEWSQRVMAPHYADYFFAMPELRLITMKSPVGDRLFVNLHLYIAASAIVINNGAGPGIILSGFIDPQVQMVGANGTVAWAFPQIGKQGGAVQGQTPATVAFEKYLDHLKVQKTRKQSFRPLAEAVLPIAPFGGAGILVGFAIAFPVTRSLVAARRSGGNKA